MTVEITLTSFNHFYPKKRWRVILHRLLILRRIYKSHYNCIPDVGYLFIEPDLRDIFGKKIMNDVELITWKKKDDIDCIHIPNRTLLEIKVKDFVIKIGN